MTKRKTYPSLQYLCCYSILRLLEKDYEYHAGMKGVLFELSSEMQMLVTERINK